MYEQRLDVGFETERNNGIFPALILLELLETISHVVLGGLQKPHEGWLLHEADVLVAVLTFDLDVQLREMVLLVLGVAHAAVEDDPGRVGAAGLVDFVVPGEKQEGLFGYQGVRSHSNYLIITSQLLKHSPFK